MSRKSVLTWFMGGDEAFLLCVYLVYIKALWEYRVRKGEAAVDAFVQMASEISVFTSLEDVESVLLSLCVKKHE